MSIGSKLESWGKSKFGNLTGLSKALNMSLSNLSQYVNDKIEPGAKIIKKLRVLGCDINWLFDIEDGKEYCKSGIASIGIMKEVSDPIYINSLILSSEEEKIINILRSDPKLLSLISELLEHKVKTSELIKKLGES